MSDDSAKKVTDGDSAASPCLAELLQDRVSCLREVALGEDPQTARKAAETLGLMVALLQKMEQTIFSQLEVLGKHHPRIKNMAQAVENQGLLDVQKVLKAVFEPGAERMSKLVNYGDLLMRWWSAVLTGVQTSVLELPNELEKALNPADWPVEKKRWSAKEEAYWNHFKFVIRHELPLKVSDQMKNIQAEKTLEAYSVLGGSS